MSPRLSGHRFALFAAVLIAASAHAVAPEEQRLSVGMGIAAPDVVNLVNISLGDTAQNPAGAMYQDGFVGNLQAARYTGKNDFGFEAGYSGKTVGAKIGNYAPACDGCKSTLGADVGFEISKDFFIGARYAKTDETPSYGAGLLINAASKHRGGVTISMTRPSTPKSDTLNYGVGYAYVTKETTFSLELTGRKADAGDDAYNKIMQAAVGFQKRVDVLQLGVTYQRALNSTADPVPENIWVAGGFNGESWHIGISGNMNRDFMATLAGFF